MALCAACSAGSREAALVEDFFAAARLQDTAALSSLSMVPFNPRANGAVRRFRITNIASTSLDQEQVTVDAQVLTPEGRIEERTLELTLERPSPDGRWRVAGLR